MSAIIKILDKQAIIRRWYSSGVLSASNFKNPSEVIAAEKTFTQPLKKAIYFLAVATNSKKILPNLDENIVASDRYSELESINLSKSIQATVDLLKKYNKALRDEIDSIHSSRSGYILMKPIK